MIVFEPQNIKTCTRCGGRFALLQQGRQPSEGAYAQERMHNLVCLQCGFVRSERFIDDEHYPLVVARRKDTKSYELVDRSRQEVLSRSIDPTNIGKAE